jgi:translation elongation factor EF-1alpha
MRTMLVGRVETGIIRTAQVITIAPPQVSIKVKSFKTHHETPPESCPGGNVGFKINNVKCDYIASDSKYNPAQGMEIGMVPVGYVKTGAIKAGQVITFAPMQPLTKAKPVEMHHETLSRHLHNPSCLTANVTLPSPTIFISSVAQFIACNSRDNAGPNMKDVRRGHVASDFRNKSQL